MDKIYLSQAKLVLRIVPLLNPYPQFAVKGGTAINYFYRPLPRLSVDIDMTYLPIADRAATLLAISDLLEQLIADIQARFPDYSVSKKQLENKTVAFRLSDRTAVIKIEPNLVIRGAVFGTEKRNIVPEAERELELFASVLSLSTADLYGGKICAALDRQHPRDLFDIKLLLDNEGVTKELRQAFLVYLVSHSRPMAELLAPNLQDIEHVFATEFIGMTRIPVELSELVRARERLLSIISEQLSEDERRFILSIKSGEPDWDLLPIPGIERLPAIQWKLMNIERMPKKKHAEAVDRLRRVLGL
ncbi:nucleotidyl transferase AbiEii/AbiGii toxin family protein [candidate division KSB1 bacterium]|nr:MAG: nucleotidyl transferase AbiEii/AbiGii toxin family protein [candidate division KSB1 bacterium]